MIYLHTGLPGAGKTLCTLMIVKLRAAKENRAVYYHGIEILKPEMFPGWTHLDDPTKWHELPDGAIIVHDEAQTLYRPRGTGAQVPEHVAKLETHRHKGHDIYFITQHPMLIESNVRRLAGEHVHVVRAFGTGMVTLHRWQQVKEQCDKVRADSIRETVTYPKEFFEAYKSATVHTHNRKIPARVYLLILLPIIAVGLIYGFYLWWEDFGAVPEVAQAAQVGGAPAQQAAGYATGGTSRKGAAKTTAEWINEQVPRVQGLPHTAPVFDAVTTVVEAPRPAACVASASRCVCYTQQGTRLDTPDVLCRQIVATGYFVAWDDTGGRNERRTEQHGQQAPQQAAPMEVSAPAPGVSGAGSSTWGGVPARSGYRGIPPA